MKNLKKIVLILGFIIPTMSYSQNCDDFTTYPWSPIGDTLGYTQSGTYPIVNVPYFGNASNGSWSFNQSSDPGMYGVTSGSNFSYDGTNQLITFEIYGFYDQYNQMGFSVNGSAAIDLSQNFPITIGNIVIDLDTSAINNGNWEHAYLTFSGETSEIEIYCFESGIVEVCVEDSINTGCTNLTNNNWNPIGDTLGYSQNGFPIINTSYYGLGNSNQNWELGGVFGGMYGIQNGAKFLFDGSSQIISFDIYSHFVSSEATGFSINGSTPVDLLLTTNYPIIINNVIVNLDTTLANNNGNWESATLSFTGLIDNIELYMFEAGILEFCATDAPNLGLIKSTPDINLKVYPNPVVNQVFITANTKIKNITLFSISGQLILEQQTIENQSTNMDVSHISEGIYFINVELTNGLSKSTKLIIK